MEKAATIASEKQEDYSHCQGDGSRVQTHKPQRSFCSALLLSCSRHSYTVFMAAPTGNFANFMRNMRLDSGEHPGFTVWQAQLQAVVRTTRTLTLTKLAAVPDLVPTLATMLKAAEQDQQISFIRQLLQALKKLPFPWAMLEGQDLLKRVLNLQKHRCSSCLTLHIFASGC